MDQYHFSDGDPIDFDTEFGMPDESLGPPLAAASMGEPFPPITPTAPFDGVDGFALPPADVVAPPVAAATTAVGAPQPPAGGVPAAIPKQTPAAAEPDGRAWESLFPVTLNGREYPRVECASYDRAYVRDTFLRDLFRSSGQLLPSTQLLASFPEVVVVDPDRHPRDWAALTSLGFLEGKAAGPAVLVTARGMLSFCERLRSQDRTGTWAGITSGGVMRAISSLDEFDNEDDEEDGFVPPPPPSIPRPVAKRPQPQPQPQPRSQPQRRRLLPEEQQQQQQRDVRPQGLLPTLDGLANDLGKAKEMAAWMHNCVAQIRSERKLRSAVAPPGRAAPAPVVTVAQPRARQQSSEATRQFESMLAATVNRFPATAMPLKSPPAAAIAAAAPTPKPLSQVHFRQPAQPHGFPLQLLHPPPPSAQPIVCNAEMSGSTFAYAPFVVSRVPALANLAYSSSPAIGTARPLQPLVPPTQASSISQKAFSPRPGQTQSSLALPKPRREHRLVLVMRHVRPQSLCEPFQH